MNLWSCAATPLSAGDFVLCFGMAAVFVVLARAAGRPKPTARAAFLDDAGYAWPEAFVALFAAEVSALTVVGVPAAAFVGGLSYAQFFVGSLLGRAACWWLAPRLREGGAVTVYGWLGRRLGGETGRAAAALFCGGRLLASALRLVAGALALQVVTGLGAAWWALALAVCAALLVGRGGLRAVVYTSGWQCLAVFSAGAAVCAYAVAQIPGGAHAALRFAGDGGRLAFYRGGTAWLTDGTLFWPACVNGAAGALAAFLADHDLTQKLLACRSDADARRAIAASAAAAAAVLSLLLAAGVCLFAFYTAHPALAVPDRFDKILPHFAATVLPSPLRGLVAAAIFLAAVDLPVSALSAASWCDVAAAGAELPAAARWALAAGWSAALAAAALWLMTPGPAVGWSERLWSAAQGPLLGLALLAAARGRPRRWVAPGSLAVALVVVLGLARGGRVDASWLILFGALAAGGAAWLLA